MCRPRPPTLARHRHASTRRHPPEYGGVAALPAQVVGERHQEATEDGEDDRDVCSVRTHVSGRLISREYGMDLSFVKARRQLGD